MWVQVPSLAPSAPELRLRGFSFSHSAGQSVAGILPAGGIHLTDVMRACDGAAVALVVGAVEAG